EGITYLFSSEANKAAFESNPAKYLPEFNGYCAYGVALGKKFNTDPSIYEIVGGKLYLNLDGNIQKKWSEDKAANIHKAHANWKEIQ
ncbi:MAG TPA: YHS domain protein, partial [Opitutae bacterium]|nr:YHS domain protein [Opitutae bacterium]